MSNSEPLLPVLGGKQRYASFPPHITVHVAGCEATYEGSTLYTDDRVRDVLLDGIAYVDIRRDALSITRVERMPINDIILKT